MIKKAVGPRTITKEVRDFEAAQKEIDRIKKESEKYNNPDDFAKYGKM